MCEFGNPGCWCVFGIWASCVDGCMESGVKRVDFYKKMFISRLIVEVNSRGCICLYRAFQGCL